MNNFLKALCCLLLSISMAHGQTLDSLKTIKLGNKQQILNNRGTLLLPAGAVNDATPVNLMSPKADENLETRIVYKLGDVKLIFYAQDLYALAGDDMYDKLKAELPTGSGFECTPFTISDSLNAVLLTAVKFDTTRQAIPLSTIVVRNPDNTVYGLSAFIEPKGYAYRAILETLAERVYATLKRGTRKINRQAHSEKFPLFGTKSSIAFQLPADYVIGLQHGQDFDVYNMSKFKDYFSNDFSNIVVYTGNSPSYAHESYGLDINTATKVDGTILGDKIQWLQFYDAQDGMYLQEQMINRDDLAKGLKVHVVITSTSKSALVILTGIVEKIKIQ